MPNVAINYHSWILDDDGRYFTSEICQNCGEAKKLYVRTYDDIGEMFICYDCRQIRRKHKMAEGRKRRVKREKGLNKDKVFKKKGRWCRGCRAKGDDVILHIHHIKPLSQGGSNLMHNLTILCSKCHKEEHKVMKYAEWFNVPVWQIKKNRSR